MFFNFIYAQKWAEAIFTEFSKTYAETSTCYFYKIICKQNFDLFSGTSNNFVSNEFVVEKDSEKKKYIYIYTYICILCYFFAS